MGIVIRVLYNNQNWQSPCKRPGMDSLCSKCFENNNLDIKRPNQADEVCSGLCWEQDICTNYEWGCTPKGRKFGKEAYKGVRVFLIFQQPDHKYTLWGSTKVDGVHVSPTRNLAPYSVGYDDWMRFKHFEPLPRDKWVRDLTAVDLVGESWRTGRYRFITAQQEAELEKRIQGIAPEKPAERAASVLAKSNITLNLTVTPIMYGRLESAANEDGRQIDEIVREAIAEWLKRRSMT